MASILDFAISNKSDDEQYNKQKCLFRPSSHTKYKNWAISSHK